ncbi:hypothetical protein GF339_12965 [candidate division KSB3 bacterium]|uniref:Uncharacterized protein n=1 Tax=candidate division KSB3 bacterium TaxID=2044937 RepID=A0A9D5JWC4_9BACT|nr:hypothetical protein [candidate division KSB3 bacterium]MBD3325494.1 hypothetical protein [candidate division KSB3 bacterium]
MEDFVSYATQYLVPLVPLVFALTALSQLVLGLLSRMGKKPKIEVYPAGNIEIGFSQHGPTVALFGTLRAQNTDAFIAKMEIALKQPEHNLCRVLEWRAFKPYTFGLLPDDDVELELTSAFLLGTKAPFKYNVVFVDDPFLTEYAPQVLQVKTLWTQYVQDSSAQDVPLQTLFGAFVKTEEAQAILGKLTNASYWNAGTYTLDMRIQSSQPTKVHTTSFQFTLSPEQADILRGNIIKILQLVCGLDVTCQYVYPEYQTRK